MPTRLSSLIALAVFVAACGGSSTSPSNSNNSGGLGSGGNALPCTIQSAGGVGTLATGTITATINGASWRGDCIAVNTVNAGIIGIGASDLATGANYQTLGFASTRAVGTYTINILSPLNALLLTTINGTAASWTAALTTGSGTLTIATSTNNSIAGTFSFVLQPQTGTPASGTKTIANGTFNLTF
jgi:hypothetical protein